MPKSLSDHNHRRSFTGYSWWKSSTEDWSHISGYIHLVRVKKNHYRIIHSHKNLVEVSNPTKMVCVRSYRVRDRKAVMEKLFPGLKGSSRGNEVFEITDLKFIDSFIGSEA